MSSCYPLGEVGSLPANFVHKSSGMIVSASNLTIVVRNSDGLVNLPLLQHRRSTQVSRISNMGSESEMMSIKQDSSNSLANNTNETNNTTGIEQEEGRPNGQMMMRRLKIGPSSKNHLNLIQLVLWKHNIDNRMSANETLNRAARNGDIDQLYTLLAHDPYILERIDHIPFVDTPLHIAARAGNTHFAMEITTLKPSLAWKLNDKGFSPVHLALQHNFLQMVRVFMGIDCNLIRIKGRGRITPLHYVAQTDDVDLLAEFLSVCPSSVKDLTIKCETAVHVAVKNQNLRAFKVLLGWLQRNNQEEILNWKDEDGNTAFHIATSTNQTEMMKLLHKLVKVNAKNFNGLTALDIFRLQQSSLSPDANRILRSAKAKTAGETSGDTLAGYLSCKLSFVEKRNKLLGLNKHHQSRHGAFYGCDMRNTVLVVAILIATAAYQAGLNPPGGYWQENSDSINEKLEKPHLAGQIIMPFRSFVSFYTINGFAFFTSFWVIFTVIIGIPYWKILYFSTSLLLYAYFTALYATFPPSDTPAKMFIKNNLFYLYFLLPLFVNLIPWVAFSRDEKRKWRVDTLLGSLQRPV